MKKIMNMKINKLTVCSILLCISSISILADTSATADPVEEIFTRIYTTHTWQSAETVSGPGSTLRVTQRMRQELSALIRRFKIASIADAPCGDCNWMRYVDIGECTYIGIDIVRELIEKNKRTFGGMREFMHLNLIENIIPQVDMIICRDMLAHLTYEQIFNVLRNFKQSGSKYLLATTNLITQRNVDLPNTGECRYLYLNLELPPFNFPRPLAIIEEDVPFAIERGKHLALWFLDDITI
jgi:hypothetical protein